MKIICIGDSLTQGYGVPSSANWVALANKIKGVELINKGINGDTTGGMLARFQKDVIDETPKYVIIMGGVNDFIVGSALGCVQANIMAMVHQAYYNKIIPIVGIVLQTDAENFRQDWAELTDVVQLNRQIEAYQKWLRQFCKTFNVIKIDFNKEFKEMQVKTQESYLIDGLHPDVNGHKILTEIVRKHFEKLFNRSGDADQHNCGE